MRAPRVFTPPKTLPIVPKLKAALAEPPTGLPDAHKAPDQQQQGGTNIESPNFIQNFGDWRTSYPGGTLLDYIVWSYLTDTKQWANHYQFDYKYRMQGGITTDFYIHYDRIAWQVKGFIYGERRDDAMAQAAEILLRKQRFRVVSLYEDDLIYRTQYTMEQALEGQQALGKEKNVAAGYSAN